MESSSLGLGEGGPDAAQGSGGNGAPPPLWPRPSPGSAPPLLAVFASSFRVALGRPGRRRRAAARDSRSRPAPRPRLPVPPGSLVNPTACTSPGPCRVRPFLYFFLLRVSVFLFQRWGGAGPGRSAVLRGAWALGRGPHRSPLPRSPRRACGACWAPVRGLRALGAASLPHSVCTA